MSASSQILTCITFILGVQCSFAQSDQQESAVSKSAQKTVLVTAQAIPPSYKIGIGDVIAITVYQEDDLSCSARVAEGGLIPLPLIGNVRVGGMSVSEATNEITAKLRDGYLVNPVVSISMVEQSKATITILGQVAKPGSIELPANGSTSLLEAIGLAGGFTRTASPSKITVKRKTGQIEKVSAKEQSTSGTGPVFIILPGDVITVPESLF